ncbi:hypothetical protein DL93DRAFT_1086220 [Clavulina sp. PMI_390]|nr:hypothetical protein DL93DRAFT_1086220 [Clavulina sp. PMI_390]
MNASSSSVTCRWNNCQIKITSPIIGACHFEFTHNGATFWEGEKTCFWIHENGEQCTFTANERHEMADHIQISHFGYQPFCDACETPFDCQSDFLDHLNTIEHEEAAQIICILGEIALARAKAELLDGGDDSNSSGAASPSSLASASVDSEDVLENVLTILNHWSVP